MGNFFSKQTENWEETNPGFYDPENLNGEEEINLGEETKVNTVETTMTMEEPSPGPRENENKETSGQTNNQENDEVQDLIKNVWLAWRQNMTQPKKGEKRRKILVFYYRKQKKQNQHLPEHKEETPQNSSDEKNDL